MFDIQKFENPPRIMYPPLFGSLRKILGEIVVKVKTNINGLNAVQDVGN
jgi:hypothetical protein